MIKSSSYNYINTDGYSHVLSLGFVRACDCAFNKVLNQKQLSISNRIIAMLIKHSCLNYLCHGKYCNYIKLNGKRRYKQIYIYEMRKCVGFLVDRVLEEVDQTPDVFNVSVLPLHVDCTCRGFDSSVVKLPLRISMSDSVKDHADVRNTPSRGYVVHHPVPVAH